MLFNISFKTLVLSLPIASALLFLSACGDTKTSSYSQEQQNIEMDSRFRGNDGQGEAASAVSSAGGQASSASKKTEPEYKEGEILVKFKEDKKFKSGPFHKAMGAKVKRKFDFIGVEHVELPPGLSVEDAIKLYMEDPAVEYAEPNYIVRKTAVPDDQYYGIQWGLPKINAPEAWDMHTGGGSAIVVVLDTGVDYEHPDLAANMWQNEAECVNGTNGIDEDGNGYKDDCLGWNFAYNTNDPKDDDVNDCDTGDYTPLGHGTHVAGIAGAIGNNASGVSGVNWNVKVMPLKFLDSCGSGEIDDAMAGVNYAIKMKQLGHNIRAINASYGGNYGGSSPEQAAITAAGNAGILFMAAAGNYGTNNDSTKFYPASYNLPNMIAVAASNSTDGRPHWSNYGQKLVHLAAPGESIFSTLRYGGTYIGTQYDSDGYPYAYISGTSMATPMVTGLSALIASYNPSLTHLQIKEAILSTVDKISQWNNLTITEGRINAHRALLLANTPEAIIMAPSNTTAVLSGSQVDIAWTDNSSNENGFDIERRTCSSGTYGLVGSQGENVTSFSDLDLAQGTTYYYRVLAVNTVYAGESNGGKSSPSAASNAITTTLPAPSGLVANATASGIELYWTDNSAGESGFRVERRTSSETSWSGIANLGVNVTAYKDTAYQPGVTYYYRVRAYTSCGSATNYSAYSNESATGPPPSSGGGCFIATAAYGSYLSPEVKTLRDFRDRHLRTNPVGRAFVALYYRISPPIADYISRHEALRMAARFALTPVVYGVKHPSGALALMGLCSIVLVVRKRKRA